MEWRIDGRRGQMQKALYSKKTAAECRICCSCLKMRRRCGIMGWKSKGRGGKRVKRSSTDTCCLTLPLKLEKWQSDRLEKRFEIGRQIYNTIVHAELKKLRKLERTQQYQEIEQKLENAKQEETKELWKKKRQLLDQNGLSENHFKADMKHYYPHLRITLLQAWQFMELRHKLGRRLKKCCFQKMERWCILRKRENYPR